MKFSTIVAAALPLLVAATPKAISDDGGKQDGGVLPRALPKTNDWRVAFRALGSSSEVHPRALPKTNDWRVAFRALGSSSEVWPREVVSRGFEEEKSGIKGDDANQTDVGHTSEHLERRDDKDHYMEECNNDNNYKTYTTCVRQVVVPKGKVNGGCIARMQKKSFSGTIHTEDSNVMCKYYENADCKGRMSGPYTNQEADYTFATYFYGQIIPSPQSFFCEIVGFQAPRLPVNKPKPDPAPPPTMSNYDGKLDSFLENVTYYPLDGVGDDSPKPDYGN